MIRLGRRALLLAAFSLLTSAATACAECAWVLWETITTKESQGSPEPVRAYTTKPDCDRALSDALAEVQEFAGKARQDGPQVPRSLRDYGQVDYCLRLPLPPRHPGPARAEGEVNDPRSSSSRSTTLRRSGHFAYSGGRVVTGSAFSCSRR